MPASEFRADARAHAERRRLQRDALGAPAIPPARVASWVTAARRRLLGLHRRSAPPPVRVLEALFAQFDAHVLRALVELDIPDELRRRTNLADLADRIGCDPAALERLLRFAAARGMVSIDRRDRVSPTGVTAALRSDAPAPWRGWVRFATSDWFDAAWRHLGESTRPGTPDAFELAHGVDFFEYTTSVDPAAGEAFDQAMNAGATLQAIALARSLGWDQVTSICDVGGGSGAALDTLLLYHPELRATLFDLPEVVRRTSFGTDATNRTAVGGSFFEEIPAGHDRYLLLAIVHDWSDAQVITILANVNKAMGPDGEAVVVETVMKERPTDDFATASDLMMFVLAAGRERTEVHFQEVFEKAGLKIREQQLLPTGATAFTLRRRCT